jgi:hypothetical protein
VTRGYKGAAAPLLATVNSTPVILKHKNLKEEHWEGEEKMASSPMQRREARDEQQAPPMEGSEA